MKVLMWMKKENSGLARTTLELAKYIEKAGHKVCIKQPGEDQIVYGIDDGNEDLHSIHSQININTYHDKKPKFMTMHGEPLSSVGNGVSMKAIVDLAPMTDAFICMRKEEHLIWNSIKKTYLVPKGIDLEAYKPSDKMPEKLSGEPSVLYIENWRGQRNPLYLCLAMQEVWRKNPKARLHLYNCTDKRMYETFDALIKNNKWWTYIRSLQGATNDVNTLYSKVDIVVSCLYPLYARGIEAFGAGKAFISAGYKEEGYPWQCDYSPESMAQTIEKCWSDYGKLDYRKWAEQKHDVKETVNQYIKIFERYL
jgi:glycosyltransferase involved in cell wall biosynthesis